VARRPFVGGKMVAVPHRRRLLLGVHRSIPLSVRLSLVDMAFKAGNAVQAALFPPAIFARAAERPPTESNRRNAPAWLYIEFGVRCS
jgi:hypothetical protein